MYWYNTVTINPSECECLHSGLKKKTRTPRTRRVKRCIRERGEGRVSHLKFTCKGMSGPLNIAWKRAGHTLLSVTGDKGLCVFIPKNSFSQHWTCCLYLTDILFSQPPLKPPNCNSEQEYPWRSAQQFPDSMGRLCPQNRSPWPYWLLVGANVFGWWCLIGVLFYFWPKTDRSPRYVFGIVGRPGSGKTTAALEIVRHLNKV